MDSIFKDDIIKYLMEADIILEEIENERNNYKFIAISVLILVGFIVFIYMKKTKIVSRKEIMLKNQNQDSILQPHFFEHLNVKTMISNHKLNKFKTKYTH